MIGKDELVEAVNDAASAYAEMRVEDQPDFHAIDDFLETLGVDPEAVWEVAQNVLVEIAPTARLHYLRAEDRAWTAWLTHQSSIWAMGVAAGLVLGRRDREEVGG